MLAHLISVIYKASDFCPRPASSPSASIYPHLLAPLIPSPTLFLLVFLKRNVLKDSNDSQSVLMDVQKHMFILNGSEIWCIL